MTLPLAAHAIEGQTVKSWSDQVQWAPESNEVMTHPGTWPPPGSEAMSVLPSAEEAVAIHLFVLGEPLSNQSGPPLVESCTREPYHVEPATQLVPWAEAATAVQLVTGATAISQVFPESPERWIGPGA